MRAFVVGLAGALALGACASNEPAGQPAPFDREADTYLGALQALGDFNGVVLLRRDGKTIHHAAYSLPDTGIETLPVTLDSRFDLRSVSKLLAKAAVFELASQGKIDPDDPIDTIFPGFPQGDRITIRHLMNNASGLPREYTTLSRPLLELSPREAVEQAAQEPLLFEPGTETVYSNVGFEVLYALIGEVTGQPFGSYVIETFFDPVGATSSGWHFEDPGAFPSGYAFGHSRKDGAIVPVLGWEAEEQARQGALYTTAGDFALVLEGLRAGPHAGSLADEDGIIAHAGGSRGKRAYGEIETGDGDAVVFLSNFDGIPFARMVTDLRALIDGEAYEIPAAVNRVAITLPQETIERLAGRYRFREIEGLVLEMRAGDGVLEIYQDGELGGVLRPESESVFFEDPTSTESIAFEEGEDGTVMLLDWQGVTWRGERIGGP
jgi:CubicO group peptidase (beta-lactamase class C family)